VEVCAVQPPGRGSRLREAPFTNMPDLISAAAPALAPCTNPPFAFFGHSLGALVAFEFARRLRRAGRGGPSHLFVSGCRAPQLALTRAHTYDLPEPEFVEELRRLKGTPEEVLDHPELLQLILPLLRADFSIAQTYTYAPEEPALSCPVTAFGGKGDEEVGRESLEAWCEQTNDSFSMHLLPGDHFFIHESQSLLLEVISRDLQRSARNPA
jgi:medium-chain acyl-[acyl-carrier-protein] hydrolase